MVFVGAENIISPLGYTAKENFEAICDGKSAVTKHKVGVNQEVFPAAKFDQRVNFYSLCQQSILASLSEIHLDRLQGKVALILSSTKGDIEVLSKNLEPYSVDELAQKLKNEFQFVTEAYTVSNACVSGIVGINLAADMIQFGLFEHIIVVGADLVSDFTLSGFQAFFALSAEQCKPYDAERNGINIGEAAATVILSKSKQIFKEDTFQILGGATRNDANHISGPSRTGEGLFRAIKAGLSAANVGEEELDYVCSHGTATNYNDEMESQAFQRAGLLSVPMNSLKAYFGHTLGAAGILETAIGMQSMRNSLLVKSLGFFQIGTTHQMNVISQNEQRELNTIIKTGSGFGGCNSSVVVSSKGKQFVPKEILSQIQKMGQIDIDVNGLQWNGELIWSNEEGDYLKHLYEKLHLNYTKFFKMDPLCKLGILGVEYLVQQFPELLSAKDDRIGLIFENRYGSSYSDLVHQVNLNGKSPSPAVFVYTLPNIVIGEISIKHKWFGESIFLINETSTNRSSQIAEMYLKQNKIDYAIEGRIEYVKESFELSLSLWKQKS